MGRVRGHLEAAVELLAPSCKHLVLMRSPGRNGPVMDRFRPRMEELFGIIEELSTRHGALVVDLYGAPVLADPRMWDVDRLHLTAEGHRRVAEAVWQTLGLPAEQDWHTELPAAVPPGWAVRRSQDLNFARSAPAPLGRPPLDGPLLRGRPPGQAPGAAPVRSRPRAICSRSKTQSGPGSLPA